MNGAAIEEPYLLPEYRDRYDMPETLVERGHYFVMGDHRTSSMDSRSFGAVPEKYIYGKADVLCLAHRENGPGSVSESGRRSAPPRAFGLRAHSSSRTAPRSSA